MINYNHLMTTTTTAAVANNSQHQHSIFINKPSFNNNNSSSSSNISTFLSYLLLNNRHLYNHYVNYLQSQHQKLLHLNEILKKFF